VHGSTNGPCLLRAVRWTEEATACMINPVYGRSHQNIVLLEMLGLTESRCIQLPVRPEIFGHVRSSLRFRWSKPELTRFSVRLCSPPLHRPWALSPGMKMCSSSSSLYKLAIVPLKAAEVQQQTGGVTFDTLQSESEHQCTLTTQRGKRRRGSRSGSCLELGFTILGCNLTCLELDDLCC
jgi:hypothetical protein